MLRNKRGIPAYNENAVLKLIIAAGVGFAAYGMTWAILAVAEADPMIYPKYVTGNIALPPVESILEKPWTVFTYGWIHSGFWVLFSNMVWLYAFGSLVQMLVGHRQVIPLFIYAIVVGGIFYELAQLLPGSYFQGRQVMMGAQAGVVALSVAALALAPDYRFYLTETFKIPLAVIAVIFYALQLINANVNAEGAPLFLVLGGALTGYGYVYLLKNGYQPAGWIYNISDGVNRRFEPDERAAVGRKGTKRYNAIRSLYKPKPNQGITQNRIDEILDKINRSGYDSLSKEEKEVLTKAGDEKNN